MKKYSWLFTIFLFINAVSGAYAQQQDHFVYIQSDDKTPFDVTVNGTTYTSSAIGYVIVPKLAKGDYKFAVGFPNKKFPDQEFTLNVDKVDAGFALKNYGEKGWGLYNLQTLDITMAGGKAGEAQTATTQQPNNNAFGNMLSEVVDDSTLNKKVEIEKTAQQKTAEEEVKQQDAAIQAVDSGLTVTAEPITGEIKNVVTPVAQSLSKLNEFISEAGRDIIFLDNVNGLNDTIRIFLPKVSGELEEMNTASKKQDTGATAAATVIQEQKELPDTVKNEVVIKTGEPVNPFFDADKKGEGIKEAEKESAGKSVTTTDAEKMSTRLTPPDCKESVSENDIDKLRKKIVSASTEDKMLAAVRKTIQDKCITTVQVRSLGALFPSDDSRYNFLKTVYTSVSDTGNLSALDSQLIDPVYKTRYKDHMK